MIIFKTYFYWYIGKSISSWYPCVL